jgi:hypothetical protein
VIARKSPVTFEVIGIVIQSVVGPGRTLRIAFSRMVEHHIENDLDAGLVQGFKQSPQSMRRNRSPVKLIDGLVLLCHEHLASALVELVEIAQTPSRSDGVFHRPPKAFHGIEMMTAVSG